MSESCVTKSQSWRDYAIELCGQGKPVEEVIDFVYDKFLKAFKSEATGKTSIRRFIHSKYNPNKPEKTFAEAVEEKKVNIHVKAKKKTQDEAILMKAATDIIIDGIKDAIAIRPYYKPQRIVIKHNINYSEETIVLMISDIQAGTYISSEATGGLNEYNWEILEKQFDRLYYGLEEIVTRHRMVAPIKTLHVHLIGDIVEGWDIFKGQQNNIDRDIGSQLLDVVDLLANLLDKARALFENIHIVGVPGNHGRIGRRGENLHYVNYDYIVYKVVQKLLSKYPEFTWQISKSWWQIDRIYDYNFFLFHGDDIKSWQGIPYYGIDRAAKNYRELLELLDLKYDYMEIGHFHMPSELAGVTTEKFINGCWPGGSIYAMKGLVTASTPVQKLFAVHPKQGVTYRYPIRLTVNDELEEKK